MWHKELTHDACSRWFVIVLCSVTGVFWLGWVATGPEHRVWTHAVGFVKSEFAVKDLFMVGIWEQTLSEKGLEEWGDFSNKTETMY